MKLASLTAISATLLALAPAAHAGGFVAAGVGTGPNLGGDLAARLDGDGHNSGRVGLGLRAGPLGVEAGLGGYGVHGTMPTGESIDGTAYSAQISASLHVGILGPLGVFGRGGLQRTWLSSEAMDDLSGDGYVIGGGLELSLPSAIARADLWLEYDREVLDLAASSGAVSGHADVVMAGVRIGI